MEFDRLGLKIAIMEVFRKKYSPTQINMYFAGFSPLKNDHDPFNFNFGNWPAFHSIGNPSHNSDINADICISRVLLNMSDHDITEIAKDAGIDVNSFIIKPKEEPEEEPEEPPQKALPAPPKKLPKPPTKAALKKFLKHEFEIPNLKTLPIDPKIAPILENRFNEARRALEAGCYLSVFTLCGSILEAVFLGLGEKNPERFNEVASSKNKTNGNKTEQFRQWGLKDFINAAVKIGFITDETGMLGEFLRHCRNYIHPYKESLFGDEPDKESAEFCFQYLQLAIVSIAKETNNDKKAKNN